MPQQLLHNLDAHALLFQHGREGSAKGMPADLLVDSGVYSHRTDVVLEREINQIGFRPPTVSEANTQFESAR